MLSSRGTLRPTGWSVDPAVARTDVFDTIRSFSQTSVVASEEASATNAIVLNETQKQMAAETYTKRRSVYRQQVSQLRKKYAAEVATLRAQDEAEERARKAAIRRAKLERQRLKNIRTAQNAMKEKERLEQRRKEFEEELRVAQMNRDARNARFNKARQLVINEMEEQAHLWLTTEEEVREALNHEAANLLWARPGGVIGAPSPTADSKYWRLECHTWHMEQTYPQNKEILLQEIMEEIYEATNVDPTIWTPERLGERKELEEKAKLRAMVRLRGLSLLLQKRSEIYRDQYLPKPDDIPAAPPVPDLRMFTNHAAMEKIGVQDLFENPTAYFHFANDDEGSQQQQRQQSIEAGSYSGPTLGEPTGLRDWIRDDTPGGTPFPVIIGMLPKITAKSERERKRMERESKMRAAAEAKMTEEERQDAEIRAELEDDNDDEPYDPTIFREPEPDEDDLAWLASLDPVEDADLLSMPPYMRYTEDDVKWVLGKLQQESKNTGVLIRQSEEGILQVQKAAEAERSLRPSQDDVLKNMGIDPARAAKIMASLTEEQTELLQGMGLTEEMSEDEIREAYRKVPTLSEEQRFELLELDLLYLRNKRNNI